MFEIVPALQYPTGVTISLSLGIIAARYTHDLKLDCFAVELYCPYLEVDADRRDVAFRICVICESQQQAGLSHAGVSDQEQLEEVVVSTR